MSLANKYRPRRFDDVVGQDAEVEVLKTIVEKGWKVSALMLTGAWGTGKTTLSRLIARALLCDNMEGFEPCGQCDSCKAVELDNHPEYLEIDSASQGLIADIRAMKDALEYQSTSTKTRIIYWDESHMLSAQAQNALLQMLEEGRKGVMFVFATTEANKMLPTISSRCVVLQMKLLTAGQIADRVLKVAAQEGIKIEERAARLIGSYVRGHVRDAMMLLEQLANTGDEITEQMARTYLRLDRYSDIYNLLCTSDRKEGMEQLEVLLCNFAATELIELIGETLINAHKLSIGIDTFTQVDKAWLERVAKARPDVLLDQAEAVLTLNPDLATVNYAIATLANVLFEGKTATRQGPRQSLLGGAPPSTGAIPSAPTRKPGR